MIRLKILKTTSEAYGAWKESTMDQAPEAVKHANQTKAIIPQIDTRGSIQGGVVHPSEGGRESPTSSNQLNATR